MFEMLLREMTLIMAQVHDSMMRLNDGFELHMSDKDWHFIIMAVMGMAMFFLVHAVFKRLAKWSITAVSFIYVFTVMTVLGFAIEIGIMAVMGMAMFFLVHAVFKRLAKWSITAVSFIYVFTVMTVLGFAIEIGQRISGTGQMDFSDIVAGLYGVLAFFAVYTAYRLLALAVGALTGRLRQSRGDK